MRRTERKTHLMVDTHTGINTSLEIQCATTHPKLEQLGKGACTVASPQDFLLQAGFVSALIVGASILVALTHLENTLLVSGQLSPGRKPISTGPGAMSLGLQWACPGTGGHSTGPDDLFPLQLALVTVQST